MDEFLLTSGNSQAILNFSIKWTVTLQIPSPHPRREGTPVCITPFDLFRITGMSSKIILLFHIRFS